MSLIIGSIIASLVLTYISLSMRGKLGTERHMFLLRFIATIVMLLPFGTAAMMAILIGMKNFHPFDDGFTDIQQLILCAVPVFAWFSSYPVAQMFGAVDEREPNLRAKSAAQGLLSALLGLGVPIIITIVGLFRH